MTGFRERFGVDLGARLPIEEGLRWAQTNDFIYADIRLGDKGNEFGTFDARRIKAVRALLEETGVHLGLHTLSAVNMAEFAPYLSDAVDRYLTDYLDLAGPLGAEWIVVHAGYHFTADYERRKATGLERLQRLCDRAEEKGVHLLLENMNPEPRDAEVKYLAQDIAECKYYFGNLTSPSLGWSYTINHAHMLPVGIEGFTSGLDMRRCGEVRVADNKGDKEEHLRPGEGTIDFKAAFGGIEARGFRGHYMLAFGTLDDIRDGRDWLVTHGKPT
jgi:sugar phosphate isomerase/epimerase